MSRTRIAGGCAAVVSVLLLCGAASPSSAAPTVPVVASGPPAAALPSVPAVAMEPTPGGKSKGKSVSPRPRRPSAWARFRSLFRGRRASSSRPSSSAPLANPLQGMHPNRMDGAGISGAVPRRTAATGGGGYSGLTPAHGQAPYTVTTGRHPVAGAGRSGALAATRPPVPASPSAPSLPRSPAVSSVVTARQAQPVVQAIPPGLQRRDPVGVRAQRVPARRGQQASLADGSPAYSVDPSQSPSAGRVVYSKLPNLADGGPGGGEPMPNRRLSLRSWGRELDADASALTGGTGIVVGDPAKGYTPIMAPPVPLPIPPPAPPSARGPKARAAAQEPSSSPPGYRGGPGRIRPYVLPIPPPPPGEAGAAAGDGGGAGVTIKPPQQHPIAKYFV